MNANESNSAIGPVCSVLLAALLASSCGSGAEPLTTGRWCGTWEADNPAMGGAGSAAHAVDSPASCTNVDNLKIGGEAQFRVARTSGTDAASTYAWRLTYTNVADDGPAELVFGVECQEGIVAPSCHPTAAGSAEHKWTRGQDTSRLTAGLTVFQSAEGDTARIEIGRTIETTSASGATSKCADVLFTSAKVCH